MCAMFVPTTPILDVTRLQGKTLDSPEFKEFMIRLTQYLNKLAVATNDKDSGEYSTTQEISGQTYFQEPGTDVIRGTFRKVIDWTANTTSGDAFLPNTGADTTPHGITVNATTIFTRIYGVATDPSTSYIPLPYASPTAANNIELSLDGTNVTITTGSDRTGYTSCYVIVEYINPQS